MPHIRIRGAGLATLALLVCTAPAGALDLTRARISAGGSGYLVSREWILAGTVGQAEASEVTRADWTLRGGFWAGGGIVTGVNDDDDPGPSTPLVFRLHPVRPQPVRGSGVVHFDLPREDHVKVELFDVSGRRVMTALDHDLPLGRHSVRVGTGGAAVALAPGVYLLRIATSRETAHQRIVLLH
jgi:hypothetical protein